MAIDPDNANNTKVIQDIIRAEIVRTDMQIKESDIDVDILYLPKDLQLSVLTSRNIQVRMLPGTQDVKGKQVVPVYHGKVKNNVIVNIHLYRGVFVAQRYIKKSEYLTPDMFVLKRRDLAGLPKTVISDPDVILGRVASFGISKDEVLLPWMFKTPVLVKKDSLVEIVANIDDITVKCTGKLLQDGVKDTEVLVENMESHKKIKGILKDSRTVFVNVLE